MMTLEQVKVMDLALYEVEITREMIEAGLAEVGGFELQDASEGYLSRSELICAIFRAMDRARAKAGSRGQRQAALRAALETMSRVRTILARRREEGLPSLSWPEIMSL